MQAALIWSAQRHFIYRIIEITDENKDYDYGLKLTNWFKKGFVIYVLNFQNHVTILGEISKTLKLLVFKVIDILKMQHTALAHVLVLLLTSGSNKKNTIYKSKKE